MQSNCLSRFPSGLQYNPPVSFFVFVFGSSFVLPHQQLLFLSSISNHTYQINYKCSHLYNIHNTVETISLSNTQHNTIRSKTNVFFKELLFFRGNPAGRYKQNREETIAGEYVIRFLTFDLGYCPDIITCLFYADQVLVCPQHHQ